MPLQVGGGCPFKLDGHLSCSNVLKNTMWVAEGVNVVLGWLVTRINVV